MTERKVRLLGWVTVVVVVLIGVGIFWSFLPPSLSLRTTSHVGVCFEIRPDTDWRRQVDSVAVSIQGVCEKFDLHPTVTVDDVRVESGTVLLHVTFGLVEKARKKDLADALQALSYEGNGVRLQRVSGMLFYEPGTCDGFARIRVPSEEWKRMHAGKVLQFPLD